MSKLYDQYLQLKNQSPNTTYLFKSGIFYIFIDDDAKRMSELLNLKETKLNDNIWKCGFPTQCLSKYQRRLELLNEKVVVVDPNVADINGSNEALFCFLEKIRELDLNETTPLQSFELVQELKKLIC